MKYLRWIILGLVLIELAVIYTPSTITLPHLPSPSLKIKRISDRGLYITSSTAQSKKSMEYIKNILKTRNLNTLVVDANYLLDEHLLLLAKQHKLKRDAVLPIPAKFKALVDELHKDGIIFTARIVAFKDERLINARPDLGIRLPSGKLYQDLKGGLYADPYSEEVRIYKELMARMASEAGVDEVQFDYIRFPAEGSAKDIILPHQIKDVDRVDIICRFLKDVKAAVSKNNTSLAVDIFGVTAWQNGKDIEQLGQDIKRMAKHIDVISPMLYPSHFHAGYDGFANPGDEPYYFLNSGIKRSLEILSGEAVALVPWIQGFNLKSPNYGPDYIAAQIKGCRDAGIKRFLIWNARNYYDTVPVISY